MEPNNRAFGHYLSAAIHEIRRHMNKSTSALHDELGYAMGRKGGSVIEYWRKGNFPPKYSDIAQLARILIGYRYLTREWLLAFLQSADYPHPEALIQELFPLAVADKSAPFANNPPSTTPNRATQETPAFSTEVPFIAGPPITNPRYFFGRENELKRILDMWQGCPLQNIAIIGPRWSGKTSFLHYLQQITKTPPSQLRPDQQFNWLTPPYHYRWGFIDFYDNRLCDSERLFRHMLTMLQLPIPTPCTLHNFLDTITERLDTPAIIMMEGIDAALTAPDLDQDFWRSLRSLYCNQLKGRLAFALAISTPPYILAQSHKEPAPFLELFGHLTTLGPLSQQDALNLIAQSPIPFPATDIAWIIEQSKCWPMALQIGCRERFAALSAGDHSSHWRAETLRQLAPFTAASAAPLRAIALGE